MNLLPVYNNFSYINYIQKGVIKGNITVYGNDVVELKDVIKIEGNLYLNNCELLTFGELKEISKDFFISYSEIPSKITSFQNIEKIRGEVYVRYTNIKDLGSLNYVGGKLNLRDTQINDLGNLKYVGGDLFLPKRLEGKLNFSKIEIKGKVRYWKDTPKQDFVTNSNCVMTYARIHQLELETNKKQLTGERIVGSGSYLNNFIKTNIDEFYKFVDEKLISIYKGKYSFYDVFFQDLLSVEKINYQFSKKFIVDNQSSIKVREKKRIASDEHLEINFQSKIVQKYIKALELFRTEEIDLMLKRLPHEGKIWLRYDENKLSHHEGVNNFFYFVENIIHQIFTSIVLGSQNDFRVSKGLPKIGEGWVSETNLFVSIDKYFENVKVHQHFSPVWLGRQHLDVFLPEFNIGIEYQGKQHSEPVDFFGGEEGYLKTVERDERKKTLCLENNCKLLYVYPETNIDDFILELETIILNK